jgi:hypothetical protein
LKPKVAEAFGTLGAAGLRRRVVVLASIRATPPAVADAGWKDLEVDALLVAPEAAMGDTERSNLGQWAEFCGGRSGTAALVRAPNPAKPDKATIERCVGQLKRMMRPQPVK